MATQGSGFGEGPMDQGLLGRYRILLSTYEFGESDFIENLRERLLREIAGNADLRPDAAHFLLVMADHMLMRPYTARLDGINFYPDPIEEPPPFRRELIAERIFEALTQILTELNNMNAPRPRSSHSVMKAIDRAWPTLALKFGWG